MSFKKIVLRAVMLLFLVSGLAFSQADREVIIMVKPGTIVLPVGRISAPIDSVTINSDTLRSVLIDLNPELIIKVFPDFNLADTIAVSPFGDTFKRLNLSLVYKIQLPEGTDKQHVANTVKALPGVIFAEANGTRETESQREPNDGFFSNQWGLTNTGQSGVGSVPGADIKAIDAWGITTGNPNIKIGIIDKGVNGNHPDLSGKVSGDVSYYGGHGTHVAGIASAKTDNDTGIAGVDWNARIIAKKCTDSQGNLDYQKIHDGIVSAVDEGAAVLNGSFSGSEYNLLERSAFAYAYRMNVVSVVSMGNEYLQGNPIRYPAAYGQGIIAVGATTDGDERASYSNTGNHIDVVAPGGTHAGSNYDQHDIESTWPEWPWYVYLGGTSMAAPHVTGLASLLKGYRGDLQNDDIEQIIRISADTLPYMNHQEWTPEYGDGRINMSKALELLLYPNYLVRSTTSGAYRAGNTDGYWMAFVATPNLDDGIYYVKRYEARKNITLPREFWGTPHVWGRTVGSTGYSGESPNLAIPFCSVVPESTTSISATLRTFVYDVWDWELNHVG